MIGGRATNGLSTAELLVVCVGILGVAGGVLLVSPLAVRALAGLAGGAPIAERLALRDLGRYRARSAAALAAVALALGLPVVIVATTAAAENQLGAGNLPADQLLVHQARLDGPFLPHPESVASMQDGVDAIAAALDDPVVLRLDGAANPNAQPDPNIDAVPGISVARKHGDDGWADLGLIYVATPELLDQYGLAADAADDAGILTRFSLPLDVMDLGDDAAARGRRHEPREASRPFQPLEAPGDPARQLHRLAGRAGQRRPRWQRAGWIAEPSGRWLITNTAPLTSDQLDAARTIAVQYGLSIEIRERVEHARQRARRCGRRRHDPRPRDPGDDRRTHPVRVDRRTAHADRHRRHRIGPATDHRRDRRRARRRSARCSAPPAPTSRSSPRRSTTSPRSRVVDLAIIVIGTPIAAGAAGWVFAGREPEALAGARSTESVQARRRTFRSISPTARRATPATISGMVVFPPVSGSRPQAEDGENPDEEPVEPVVSCADVHRPS